jgi:hypothetical protein
MTDKEIENAEEAAKVVEDAKELAAAAAETVSLAGSKKRKRRNLNLSKSQKRGIRYLRMADRVGIVFGGDSIRVSRADSIRLVEKNRAKVVVAIEDGVTYCTMHPVE